MLLVVSNYYLIITLPVLSPGERREERRRRRTEERGERMSVTGLGDNPCVINSTIKIIHLSIGSH